MKRTHWTPREGAKGFICGLIAAVAFWWPGDPLWLAVLCSALIYIVANLILEVCLPRHDSRSGNF
jgi:hypothetical protein